MAKTITVWRILLAVAAFFAIASKSIHELKLVPEQPTFDTWLIFLGAALVLIDSLARIILATRYQSRQNLEVNVKKTVRSTLKVISELTGLDVWSLGGSVYIPKRSKFRKVTTLDRVARVRLSDSPQPSPVRWTTGKGVIGQVLQDNRRIYKSWKAIADRWPSDDLTEVEFQKIKLTTRSGFSYREFLAIVDKYAEILGVPIWSVDQKSVIGVFAIDVPMALEHPNLGHCLEAKSVWQTAERCAGVLTDVIAKR